MNTESLNQVPTRFRQVLNKQFCPECGTHMKEVDRCRENGALFVWYQCSRNDCDGQWLQKIPHHILNSL